MNKLENGVRKDMRAEVIRREPPLPEELWDQLPSSVQAALWVVVEEYEWRIATLQRVLQKIVIDLQEAGTVVNAPSIAFPSDTLKDLRNLSPREWEILQLLLANYRTQTIARSLHISTHTVRTHLKSIFRKLGVRSQISLLERLGQYTLKQ